MSKINPPVKQSKPKRDAAGRPAASGEPDKAAAKTGTFESNGSTGDQIGGQSLYAERELKGRTKGLPKR